MSRRRPVLGLLALLCALCAGQVQAQIVVVRLADEKAARRYKKAADGLLLTGEPRTELLVGPGGELGPGDGELELFVLDRKDPAREVWRLKKGERVPDKRTDLVRVRAQDRAEIRVILPGETMVGIAREYRRRREALGALADALGDLKPDAPAWPLAYDRLVAGHDSLAAWLENVGQSQIAEEVAQDALELHSAALAGRAEDLLTLALGSIERVDPPAELLEATGGVDYFAQESLHLRILYEEGISHDAVRAALELGERILTSFRLEHVEPHVQASLAAGDAEPFEDRIPRSEVFHEFLITPDDNEHYASVTSALYPIDWEKNAQALELRGTTLNGVKRVRFATLWKNSELNLEAVVAHRLGHSVARQHFGRGTRLDVDWIEEALGYHFSFTTLGWNGVLCHDFTTEPVTRARRREVHDEHPSAIFGRREAFQALALSEGQPLERLCNERLREMGDGDLAKAWSLLDWILATQGRSGHELLRAAGSAAAEPDTYLARWREAAASYRGSTPGEVLAEFEAEWRAHAEADLASGSRRSR